MVEKDDQLETEQVDVNTLSTYMRTDTSDAQEDSAAEDKFCSLDELHILDMVEQVSTGEGLALSSFLQKELWTLFSPESLSSVPFWKSLAVYAVVIRKATKKTR